MNSNKATNVFSFIVMLAALALAIYPTFAADKHPMNSHDSMDNHVSMQAATPTPVADVKCFESAAYFAIQ